MNRIRQNDKILKTKPKAPIYASPWMALFLGLRDEFVQARSPE